MAFDRDDTLKKAEKLLRQGRLEPAIAEYVRVVEESAARLEHRQHARRSLRARRPAAAGGRAVRAHRRALRRRGLLSEGRRALQEDPQAPAPGRDDAASARRHLGEAGAARRRQVASQRHRRAPPRQGRSPRRGRDRRPARHHRSGRLRGAARRRADARGDGRGGGGRQAVQGAARRSAREGPDRRGARRAQGVRPHQSARTRGPLGARRKAALEQGDLDRRARVPRSRTAPATIRRCCCRWPRSSCDRAS